MNKVQLTLVLLFLSLVAATAVLAQQRVPESLLSAVSLYEQGKLDEAIAKCQETIASDPTDFRVHVLLASIYTDQRKLKMASDSYAQAIKLQPRAKEVYLMKSRVDYLRNAHADAVAAAQGALEVDPGYGEAHMTVGALLKNDKTRKAEAIAALKTAIEINPKLLPAYEELGEIFVADQPEEAEAWFRTGMAADPRRMVGRFALGRMMVKQGRLKEARELWDGRTYDADRTHPQFIDLLKRAEKLQSVTDALAKKPNDPDALVDMGIAVMDGESWVVDGRQKRAVELFRKALAAKPDYSRAQYQIVKAYIQMAYTFKDENKNVDAELTKLRQLDPKLAAEMDQYRKEYQGGIRATPVRPDQ